MVLLVRGWLVHYFRLLGADGEAEVVAGYRKTVHLRLHFLLIAGADGTVVSKEKVSENSLLHLRNRLQPPGAEQFPIGPVSDVMPGSQSLKASGSIAENNKLSSIGTRTQPCLTPLVTGKTSDDSP